MKTCAYCRSDLPEDAVKCPNCAGSSFTTQAVSGPQSGGTSGGEESLNATLEHAGDSAQTLAESGVRVVSAVGMLVVVGMTGLFVLGFVVVWVLVLLGWDPRF